MLFSLLVMIEARHRLTGFAIMDFGFLATLGMTGIRGWIVATNPFCLPLSACERERHREGGSPAPNAVSSYVNNERVKRRTPSR